MAKTRQPNDIPGASYLAKRYANHHGYSGGIGGWIYDKDGKPVNHGWLRFFINYRSAIMPWAMHHSGLHSKMENGKLVIPTPLDVAHALYRKRIPKEK